jgi:hypothetical protein
MKAKIREARPEDAKLFASWVAGNADIPVADKKAVADAVKADTLVVEVDGKPEMFLPLLEARTIRFLGFNPEQDVRTKAKALRAMCEAVGQFQRLHGIEDVYVFTKAEYPLGKWALKNGFKEIEQDGFTLERQ